MQVAFKVIQRNSCTKQQFGRTLTVARPLILNQRLQEMGDAIQDEFLEAFLRLADQ